MILKVFFFKDKCNKTSALKIHGEESNGKSYNEQIGHASAAWQNFSFYYVFKIAKAGGDYRYDHNKADTNNQVTVQAINLEQ